MIARSAPSSQIAEETPEPDPQESSRIDSRTTVDGTLTTTADLRVEGRALGTIACGGVLYIAEGAEVNATVEAGGIVVAGSLAGDVRCHERLEIRSTGVVRARVTTARLMILEGAVYEGQLRMEARTVSTDVSEETDEPGPNQEPPAPPTPSAYSFLRSFTAPPTPAQPADDLPELADTDDEP